MNDLISKSKLIEEILEEASTKILGLESGVTLGEMKEWVENQPVVEAVPVVHGEWILEEKAGVDYWCCSHCHKIRSEYYAKPKDNFCPNCGTYMRKKENKENDES